MDHKSCVGGKQRTAALVKNSTTIQLECIVVKISDINCKDIFLLNLWKHCRPWQGQLGGAPASRGLLGEGGARRAVLVVCDRHRRRPPICALAVNATSVKL